MDLLPPIELNPTFLPQGFSDPKCHYYILYPYLFHKNDNSQIGGSDDMESSVVVMAIVSIWDFIFMLPGLDMVLYIVGYLYILYITLSRLIFLYSRYRVN